MKKQHVQLSEADRAYLEALISKGELSGRLYRRALGLLELDRGKSYSAVSEVLNVTIPALASWAAKYQESGLEVLYDQSPSGRPIKIAGDQRAKITALACREPPEGYAHWSSRLLADKVVELEYCEHISHTEVNEILTPALVCGACTAVDNREIWFDLSEGRLLVRRRNRSTRRRSARQKDKVEREGTVLRAKNKKHFCGIDQAEKFGKLLWATGCTVGADRARIFVFICDGANWIWNLIAFYFPNAVQIVDWYHAADRLHRIAVEVFSDLTERQAWLRVITKYLWQG